MHVMDVLMFYLMVQFILVMQIMVVVNKMVVINMLICDVQVIVILINNHLHVKMNVKQMHQQNII